MDSLSSKARSWSDSFKCLDRWKYDEEMRWLKDQIKATLTHIGHGNMAGVVCGLIQHNIHPFTVSK